jgi:hypothetical protein
MSGLQARGPTVVSDVVFPTLFSLIGCATPFGPQTADARRQLVVYLGHREQAPVEGVSDPHQKSLKEHAHIRFSSSVRFHLFASASAIT